MKTTTKRIAIAFSLLVTVFITSNASAQTDPMMTDNFQKGWRLGIGVNGGLFEKGSPLDYGWGADLKLQVDLARALSLTVSGGYERLAYDNNAMADVDFIPVKGGIKIFPFWGRGMYLGGEAGAGFAIQNGAKTNFIWNGGIGWASNGGFDMGVRYEGYVNDSASSTYFMKTGQFNLRLAYGFKL